MREIDRLRGLDLHMVRALCALVERRSVTQAAHALGVSQSAMSNTLAKLRRLLVDPVLVQTSRAMEPTEKALRLVETARRALAMLGDAIDVQDRFEPAQATDKFVLCTSDYVAALMLPGLMRRLGEQAPGVSIGVKIANPASAHAMLDAGECDCMVSYFGELQGDLHASLLLKDRPYVLARSGHPTVSDGLTLETYLACRHVGLGGGDTLKSTLESVIDDALARVGRQRSIALRLPHALVTPRVVAASDLISTLSRQAASAFAQVLPLQVLPLPLDVPDFTISMVWHERAHRLPAHIWLRQQIRDTFNAPIAAASHDA